MPSFLTQLELTPTHIPHLPAKTRNSLLSFLLRWDGYADALACLAQVNVAKYVSFQDAQAQALVGLNRAAEAVAVMEKRVAERDSIPARIWLVRAHMAAGNHASALAALQPILTESAGPAWTMRGDVLLAQAKLDEAERAYLRHREIAPSSRAPGLGLARLYHARGDGVTAAAYAVSAYTLNEGDYPHTIHELQQLRALFESLGDANRLVEIETTLQQRQADELADLAAQLDGAAAKPARPSPDRTPGRTLGRTEAPPAPPLPNLDAIPVSAAERDELTAAAQTYFGFPSLRPGQAQIMACPRRGENVLAILPTGAGKSLCYQLPALLDGGTTLVISPLIALMKDQIDNLPAAARAQSIAINSSMEGQELLRAVNEMAAGRYRLVYAAPERLRQLPFLHALRRANLARLVIDEAHCVSAWGHDFRPDYLYLARAHKELGAPPILALTATAPVQVRHDIQRQLFGTEGASADAKMRVIALDSFRPNLRLASFPASDKDDKLRRLIELCSTLEGSGIVYARTRQQCEDLAALLRDQGVDAVHYHAWHPKPRRCARSVYERQCRVSSSPPSPLAWAWTSPTFASSSTLVCPIRWNPTIKRRAAPGGMARQRTVSCSTAAATKARLRATPIATPLALTFCARSMGCSKSSGGWAILCWLRWMIWCGGLRIRIRLCAWG